MMFFEVNLSEVGTRRDKKTYEEKNYDLYLRQKQTLDLFLERGAIARAQHDKSLHDLTVKMGVAV